MECKIQNFINLNYGWAYTIGFGVFTEDLLRVHTNDSCCLCEKLTFDNAFLGEKIWLDGCLEFEREDALI
jgi:hypothetical protein